MSRTSLREHDQEAENASQNLQWWKTRWTVLLILFFLTSVASLFIATRYYVGHPNDTPAFVSGLIGLLTLYAIIVQVAVNRHQWKAMNDALQLTDRQLKMMAIGECAYISFEGWNFSEIQNNILTINGIIFNGGRSPSWDLRTKFQITLGEGTPPDYFVGEWDEKIRSSSHMLVAGERTPFTVGSIKVTQDTLDKLYDGTSTLIVDGRCTYLDVLGVTQIYEVGYLLQFKEGDHRFIERYKKVSREGH